MRSREIDEIRRLEDHYWWHVGRRRLVVELVRRYSEASEQCILDAGCGTGATMAALQGSGRVFGCDLSTVALRHCEERSLRRLAASRLERLGFTGSAFDVLVSCDVLEHVEDDRAALKEMYRVLQPGGLLILTVPGYPRLWSSHDDILRHVRRYRPAELRSKLEDTGLTIARLSHAVLIAMPAILLVSALEHLLHRPLRPGRTGLIQVGEPLNRLLIWALDAERQLILRTGIPLGSSLVAVARKPEA
jgi:SAM-dependent methyltransferase